MRNKMRLLFCLLIAGVAACSPKKVMVEDAAENYDQQLSAQLTQSVLWYQLSAERKIICQSIYAHATEMMTTNAERYMVQGRPMAVILDIDETVLDNSPYEGFLIKNGLTFTPESWREWVSQANAKLIPGAAGFITRATDLGLEVFYVSNRGYESLSATMSNLQLYDLPFIDPDHILLKTDMSDKTERREQIKESHTVVFSVGDQFGDFMSEGYMKYFGAEVEDQGIELPDSLKNHFALLPNPMYGEFAKAIMPDSNTKDKALILKIRKQALNGIN
jgi:5'-nucleotidase (lipoprotein e(P4) family)